MPWWCRWHREASLTFRRPTTFAVPGVEVSRADQAVANLISMAVSVA
jgi:hypothetical protein